MTRTARSRPAVAVALLVVLVAALSGLATPAPAAESYQRISGEGSSWAGPAIDAMRVNVKQFGITVDFNPSGSSAGRKNWLNGTVDFAASDIPFQFKPEDGSAPENPDPGSYAYIPVTAGGTSFMYNLKINGKRVTNLRLSGENVAKIFAGAITQWNDPAIAADNPGLVMPARKVVPVVRSDGSGSSAQFTTWLIARHGSVWNAYCKKSGRAPACGSTSFYPTIPGMISQSGDLGVAGYVSQSYAEGAIGYVNYSYALGQGFPVAKVLNAAGYYTEPTPDNVAVSLLKARINTNKANRAVYLTQDLSQVYTNPDPRNYELSSYSYFILPTKVRGQFTQAKGRTLGAFAYYAMCQAQQQSASLGYSPMPINLVQASFEQIKLVPGVEVQNINIQQCKNPTFSPDGTNTLVRNAPQPQACDRRGASQCPNGTAGARNIPTAVKAGTSGGQAGTSGGQPGTSGGQAGGSGGQAGAGVGGGAAPGATGGVAGGPVAAGGSAGASGGFGVPGAADGDPGAGDLVGGAGDPGLTGGDGIDPSACDPETGICDGGFTGSSSGGDQSLGSGELASATPTVLSGSSGWSGTQTLAFVVLLLTLALVLAPAGYWIWLQPKDDHR